MYAILSVGVTSIQSLPMRTTGHDFLHSWRHLLGLHLSAFTMAILVSLSAMTSLRVCETKLSIWENLQVEANIDENNIAGNIVITIHVRRDLTSSIRILIPLYPSRGDLSLLTTAAIYIDWWLDDVNTHWSISPIIRLWHWLVTVHESNPYTLYIHMIYSI